MEDISDSDGNADEANEATRGVEDVAKALFDIGGIGELEKLLPPLPPLPTPTLSPLPPLHADVDLVPDLMKAKTFKPISVVMGSNLDSMLPNIIYSSLPVISLNATSYHQRC